MPVSGGHALKNWVKASKPPAEAPSATIGKGFRAEGFGLGGFLEVGMGNWKLESRNWKLGTIQRYDEKRDFRQMQLAVGSWHVLRLTSFVLRKRKVKRRPLPRLPFCISKSNIQLFQYISKGKLRGTGSRVEGRRSREKFVNLKSNVIARTPSTRGTKQNRKLKWLPTEDWGLRTGDPVISRFQVLQIC